MLVIRSIEVFGFQFTGAGDHINCAVLNFNIPAIEFPMFDIAFTGSYYKMNVMDILLSAKQ